MKYYTEIIPSTLAEKLKEKGMPMMPCLNITPMNSFSDDGGIHFHYLPTYAEVFDWLTEMGIYVGISLTWDKWCWNIYNDQPSYQYNFDSWHEAANAAIEKALTLI